MLQAALTQSFSILERIVGVETEVWFAWEGWSRLSFSILERIVGVETPAKRLLSSPLSIFQYPRTDRWG